MDTHCRDVFIMAMTHVQIATKILVGSFAWNDFNAVARQRFVDELRHDYSDDEIIDVIVTLDLCEENKDMHDFIVSVIYP